MKVAILYFVSSQGRQAFKDLVRPYDEADFYFDPDVPVAYVWGSSTARACEVAKLVRGTVCKLRDEAQLEAKPPTIYIRAKTKRAASR